MEQNELLYIAETILDDVKTAILSTTDRQGASHMRWMTPVFLKNDPGILYCVTSPHFQKVLQLQDQPMVEWMIQTPALDKIVNLSGVINILDNPSIKNEVMEAVGKRLQTFWKINPETEFVVLETIINKGSLFLPMKSQKELVCFS